MDALWDQVEKRGPKECWPFVGTISSEGYGIVRVDGQPRYAHVLACESKHGPMQRGEVARHMCAEVSRHRILGRDFTSADASPAPSAFFDRRCANPDHLRPGSVRANALDRERAKATRR